MKISIKLTKAATTLAVDPIELTALSTTGQPTNQITLVKNYAIGIIGFLVPQGVSWLIDEEPALILKLWQDAAGTTQIAGGDTVSLYVKAPADPPDTLGTKITSTDYQPWYDLDTDEQKLAGFRETLKLQTNRQFKIEANQVLIVAVSTLLTTETIDWTKSRITIPAWQISGS